MMQVLLIQTKPAPGESVTTGDIGIYAALIKQLYGALASVLQDARIFDQLDVSEYGPRLAFLNDTREDTHDVQIAMILGENTIAIKRPKQNVSLQVGINQAEVGTGSPAAVLTALVNAIRQLPK
jgi:hypothetical protein